MASALVAAECLPSNTPYPPSSTHAIQQTKVLHELLCKGLSVGDGRVPFFQPTLSLFFTHAVQQTEILRQLLRNGLNVGDAECPPSNPTGLPSPTHSVQHTEVLRQLLRESLSVGDGRVAVLHEEAQVALLPHRHGAVVCSQ